MMTPSAMTRFTTLAACAFMLLISFSAMAEEGDWYLAASTMYFDDDGDRLIDDTLGGLQLQVGREMGQRFSLEGLLGYHDIDGYPGQEHLEIGINAIGKFMPDSRFSPYVMGGLGYLRADVGEPDFGGLPTAGEASGSGTATAGVGVDVALGNSPWSLRAEYRLRQTFSDSLLDQIGSIGVQYSFGGGAARATTTAAPAEPAQEAGPVQPVAPVRAEPTDTDRDGVTDERDKCPGTAPGRDVDANGCEKPRFRNVYFDTESAELSDLGRRKLDETAAALERHAGLEVEIAGHADSRGPEEYNQVLSERRAEAVRRYLEQKGIDPARMTTRGYGEARPIRSNDTLLGQSDNRRVELHAMGRD
jgi:OmpA-OmpF porin, OOP family